jgi:N-acetyl-gamma-glutamyl-phosphate reductase
MSTVSIINVTSYTALELLRLLAHHPQLQVTSVTGRSSAGKRLGEVFPQLYALSDDANVKPDLIISEVPEQTDLAFVCLPHAAAAETAVEVLRHGTKVIDLSADFRLHDAAVYEEWYKHTHPAPALLEMAIYGLCERYRERIAQASLVANPGCHATTAILALAPALAAGIIEPSAVIDSKTGVSGAGRSPSLTTHYAEANEDVNGYSLGGHRHLPEIAQELFAAAADGGHPLTEEPRLTFIPYLLPMTRGILSTCYADLRPEVAPLLSTSDVLALYERYYAGEPFVHVVNQSPHTKWTYGSNHCFIHPFVDMRTRRFVVIACLDNLVKGAAGQAIQNANLLCGLPETTGLQGIGVNP